jgi:hypothetical protein
VLGKLESSGFEIPEIRLRSNGRPFTSTKRDDWRMFTGLILVWHPPKMPGFSVGAGRTFIGYGSGLTTTADYFPLFQPFQKDRFRTDDNPRGNDALDQRLALFFRYVLPSAGLEVYGEFGREDHAANIRDIVLEPNHSSAYIWGVRKKSEITPTKTLIYEAELAHFESSNTSLVRETPSWYVHHIIRHGTTHRGQLMGAGIGTGSNSRFFSLTYHTPSFRFGTELEHIMHNMDMFRTLGNISGVKRNFSYVPGITFGYTGRSFMINMTYRTIFERNRHYFPTDLSASTPAYWNPINYNLDAGIRYSF